MAASIIAGLGTVAFAGPQGAYVLAVQRTGFSLFAASTATYAVLGAISKQLLQEEEFMSASGVNFNVRDPESSRKIVYGKTRIGGTIVFFNTSDTDNNYLHMVIAVAGHEIESFEEVYFGEEKVWENGSYLNDWDDHCLLNFHDGSQTTADSTLVNAATGFTNDHKLLDTAYIYARLDYDPEKFTTGVPNISCVIKGKKVYDPRTSTTAWSENPALILNDYLTDTKYGLGEDAINIDATALTTAANLCDNNIQIISGENVSSQKRYTCNGILDTASSLKSNVENILTSMLGSLHWADGKFYMQGFDYVDPVSDAIDEDILVAPIKVSTKRSRSTLYNTVKGTFVSEENNYIVSDYPAQSIASYATDDGEEVAMDLTLPMTNENRRAQRLAYITLKKSRLQMSINMQLNLSGLKYKVGDNVKVVNTRFGWTTNSPKIFEITNLRIVPDPEKGIVVEIDAVENADIDDWSGTDLINYVVPTPPNVYTGTTVVAPTNLKIYAHDGKRKDGIKKVKISWDGVEESDGVTPYEPYFKQYIVEVTNNTAGKFNINKTYKTIHTNELIDIHSRPRSQKNATVTTTIKVFAENIRGYKSSPLTKTNVKSDVVYPEEPIPVSKTIYGTEASPSSALLSQKAQQAGIQVYNGTELLYTQLDANNDPIDSAQYVFTTENFEVISNTDLFSEEVDTTANPELVTNGTFSDTSSWTFVPDTRGSITGGQMVFSTDSGTCLGVQTLTTDDIGEHTLTFNVNSLDTASTTIYKVKVKEGGADIFETDITSTGTKTINFTSQNRNLQLLFFKFGGTDGASIDNVSVKATLPDAIQEYTLFLPDTVTETVTFSHAETDVIDLDANGQASTTGVTKTYTGFSSPVNLFGRKYVKVLLQRSTDNPGISQQTVTVTATWTTTGGDADEAKEAKAELLMTARVI
nr:hypothetical protein [uncultured Mediterranean phage uvMED]